MLPTKTFQNIEKSLKQLPDALRIYYGKDGRREVPPIFTYLALPTKKAGAVHELLLLF
ncbi:hypothetical protein [Pseudanabaena minima]|uniref:hypothetical protein n=1 Tax=Pseudanabaena minima TaxID=890415 RepID=UPI003DA829D9